MRGKVSTGAVRTFPAWITPAHAGKSKFFLMIGDSGEDHPRTCGEKLVLFRLLAS